MKDKQCEECERYFLRKPLIFKRSIWKIESGPCQEIEPWQFLRRQKFYEPHAILDSHPE